MQLTHRITMQTFSINNETHTLQHTTLHILTHFYSNKHTFVNIKNISTTYNKNTFIYAYKHNSTHMHSHTSTVQTYIQLYIY